MPRSLLRLALGGAAVLAALHVAAVLAIMALRVGYPHELEWMEGACVDHVGRLLDGEPIYAEPSLEHVPLLYAPLWFYAAAAASWVLGPGFLAARLVSALASLATLGLLFEFARRETGGRAESGQGSASGGSLSGGSLAGGLVAAGLYAAAFRIGGAWFDVARVDALFIALILGAAFAVRFGRGLPSAGIGGGLIALAFLTKQLALVPAAALWIAALVAWKRALVFGGVAALIGGGATLAFDATHDGWYRFFVFTLPSRHARLEEPPPFWSVDLGLNFGGPIALAIALLIGLAVARRFGALLFHGAWLAALIGAAWLGRMHPGGWDNVLLPAYLGLALAGGIAVGFAWQEPADGARRVHPAVGLLACLIAAATFVQRAHDPRASLPTDADRAARDLVVERIAEIDGDVFAPSHGWLTSRAGKGRFLHLIAWLDLKRSDEQLWRQVADEIDAAFAERRFAALVLDSKYMVRNRGAGKSYRAAEELSVEDAGWPITGRRTRPESLYLPSGPSK